MREHIINHHVGAGLKYRCPKCTNISGSKNALRAHISLKHPELVKTGLDYNKFLLEEGDSSSVPSTTNDVAASTTEVDKETSSDAIDLSIKSNDDIDLLIKSNKLITSQIEKHSQIGARKKKDIKRATPSVPERMEEGEKDATTEKRRDQDVPNTSTEQGKIGEFVQTRLAFN